MKKMVYLSTVAITVALLPLAAYGKTKPVPNNWGQQVKACNHEPNCYPGGGNRGSYVSKQARDADRPGYANEIHNLAKPGKSNPKPFNR